MLAYFSFPIFILFYFVFEGTTLFSGGSLKEAMQVMQMVHTVQLSLGRWFRFGIVLSSTNCGQVSCVSFVL